MAITWVFHRIVPRRLPRFVPCPIPEIDPKPTSRVLYAPVVQHAMVVPENVQNSNTSNTIMLNANSTIKEPRSHNPMYHAPPQTIHRKEYLRQ